MIATSFIIAAAMMTVFTNAPSAAEIRNVRFASPRLAVSRPRADSSSAVIYGRLRVDMGFAKATARKPVLRIVCLCEAGGSLVCYQGLWDRPNTYRRLERSEIMAAFRDAGYEPSPAERETAYRDPATITRFLPEVSKTAYSATTYGSSDIDRGFFRIDQPGTQTKVLLFRLELWQNGNLVGSYDSPKTGLGKYELPDDWHVWKRYRQKFRYIDRF